jgi:hypothetical protein
MRHYDDDTPTDDELQTLSSCQTKINRCAKVWVKQCDDDFEKSCIDFDYFDE